MKNKLIFLLLLLNIKLISQDWTALGTWTKGAWTGPTKIIKFVDNLMIFDAGRSLRICDISNIDAPRELDAVYVPPVEDIHIYNSYIFVKLSFQDVIKIYRISEGFKLIFERDLEFDKNIIEFNIINNKLLVLSPNEISIYSIANGFNISLDNTISCINNQYSQIVGNEKFFILSYQAKISIYQLNENNSYTLFSNFNTGGGGILDMQLLGDNLIISGYHIGLRIVNINQLSKPTVIGSYFLDKTGCISVSNNAVFIHDYLYEGIKIFDITKPATPIFKSEYHVGKSYTGENYYYKNRLFLGNNSESKIYELEIINDFEANYLQDIVSEDHQYKFYQIQIYNNTAILRTNFGITFVNASNYEELEIYSEINDIGSVSNMKLVSNKLYVSAEDKILIYDISNPFDVILISSFTHHENISSFFIENDLLYLYSPNFFTIYSIKNLNDIQQQFQHLPSLSGDNISFSRMVKLGDQIHLYVYRRSEYSIPEAPTRVDVINVSDSQNAKYSGYIEGRNYRYKLYENNGTIYGSKISRYMEDLTNELHVCSIANVDSVYSIYQTELSDVVNNLYFYEKYAYVRRFKKLMTVDLSIPTNPVEINSTSLNFDIRGQIIAYKNIFYFFGINGWRNSVGIYRNNITSISEDFSTEIPNRFNLNAYPNPFNLSTTIRFSIPKDDYVHLVIYDLLGKEIRVIVDEEKSVGSYKVIFDASNLPSGLYFYRLQSSEYSETKKLLLLK